MNEIANLLNSITDLLREFGFYLNLFIGFLIGIASFLITSNPKLLNRLRRQVKISFEECIPSFQQSKIIKIRMTYELVNGSNEDAKFNFIFIDFGNDKIRGNNHNNEPTLFELINPTQGKWYISSDNILCESDSIIRKSKIIDHYDLINDINTYKPKKIRIVIQGAKFGHIKSNWKNIHYS